MTGLHGLIYGLEANKYHAESALSNSLMSDIKRSPAYAWAVNFEPGRPPRKNTPAMMAGTLTHCAILERVQFDERYTVQPHDLDMRTTAGKAWKSSASDSGITVIDGEQRQIAFDQRASVFAVPELESILTSGKPEVSVFWADESTGVKCKARPDWLHRRADGRAVILDIKTTREIEPEEFGRSVAKYGYHRQAAHYIAGLEAHGIDVAEFVFGVVSSVYPYQSYAAILDEDTLAQGREEVSELTAIYAECNRTGVWPGYSGYQVVGLPAWARRSIEMEIGYV